MEESLTGPSVSTDPATQFGWRCGGTYSGGTGCGLEQVTLRGEPGLVAAGGINGGEIAFALTQDDVAQATGITIFGNPTNRCAIICNDAGPSVTVECFSDVNGACTQVLAFGGS